MQGVKDRLKQFIDYKALSERKFSQKISPSATYFTSTKTIGSDKLEKIAEEFPELNMDWVITGRGEMLYKEHENAAEWKEKYYQLLDMKVTLVSAENEELKKAGNVVTLGHTDELSQVAEPAVELKKEE